METPSPLHPAPSADDGCPRDFGPYRLLSRLGIGGMAELFVARDTRRPAADGTVVVKRVRPELQGDPEFVSMLRREARFARKLVHPHLVETLDGGEIDGEPFVVLEHLHGEDLRAIVRRMRERGVDEFPLPHVITIVAGVAQGLSHLHGLKDERGRPAGVVHRDVSPQNVLVTFDGGVKLLDFGIARAVADPERPRRSATDTLPIFTTDEPTLPGRVKGKLAYMAPEQLATPPRTDARSDQFALGIVLFELATNRRLFRAESQLATVELVRGARVPRPSEVHPRVGPATESVLLRSLALAPEDRFRDVEAFRVALLDAAARDGIEGAPHELGVWLTRLWSDAPIDPARESGPSNVLTRAVPEALRSSPPAAPASSQGTTTAAALASSRSTRIALAAAASLGLLLAGVAIVGHRERRTEGLTGVQHRIVDTIEVHSVPEGAEIWLDGVRRTERTPSTLTGLTGRDTVSLALRIPGRHVHRQVVDLAGATTQTQVTAVLAPVDPAREAQLTVETVPPGAQVLLDGEPALGVTPLVLEGVPADRLHAVQVLGAGARADFEFRPVAGARERRVIVLRRPDPR